MNLVAVAVHDGFYSCGTGSGMCNRALLEVLVEYVVGQARLLVLPIHLDPSDPAFDPSWHRRTRELVQRAGGQVVPVDNGSGGRSRFGRLQHLRRASVEAAAILLDHRGNEEHRLLVAVDVPFFGVGLHLPPDMTRDLVLVAQGVGAMHAPDDTARLEWERRSLQAAIAGGGRVAATSLAVRQALADTYGVGGTAVVDLPNGLTTREWVPVALSAAPPLPSGARTGFILAMGRAEAHKGFDDLLDAIGQLRAAKVAVPHLVLAAVTDDRQVTEYQRHLAQRLASEDINATLWTDFSHGTRGLLKHPALRAVVVPSRVEPFGRIPLEAFAAGAAVVVATTAGGLAALVKDGQTGFTAPPSDPAMLAVALRRALSADESARHRLREAGRRFADRYDYRCTVRHLLRDIAPWLVSENRTQAA